MFRWRRRSDDDFAAEVRSHIELEEARLVERGVSPDEARRRARVAFGSATNARERFRDSSPWRWLETLGQDVRYGTRLLRRSPAFALTAVVVLSLGIGVNVALFSIVSSVFFRRIPIPRADRVAYVFLRAEDGTSRPDLTKEDQQALRSAADELAEFTSHVNVTLNISVGDEARVAAGELVEANYFDVLQLRMQHGRGFRPEEDDPSNPELSVVISDALWKTMFGGRADVVGAEMRVRSQTYRIIGVAPEGFGGLASPWAPSMWWATRTQVRTGWNMAPIARAKPGVSMPRLMKGIGAAGRRIVDETWETWPPAMREKYPRARARAFVAAPVAGVQVPNNPDQRLIPANVLIAVVVVVFLVLVIAATNVAGLLLARGTSRVGEVAVRQALGAAGGRLFRQVVTESVMLGLVGGLVGTGLAFGLVRAFEAFTPERFNAGVTVDARVVVVAVIGCVITGMLVGIAPALQAKRVSLLHALGAGVVGARRTGRGGRRWIVIPQVTVSIVLAVVAAVHVRTLRQLELRNLGYRTDGVTVSTLARSDPNEEPRPGPLDGWRSSFDDESRRKFIHDVLDRALEEPGIGVLAMTNTLPVGTARSLFFQVRGDNSSFSERLDALVTVASVSERFFDALGMRLVAGRSFELSDGVYPDFREQVLVISASVARAFGGAHAALGQRVGLTIAGLKPTWCRVVGVTGDIDPVMDDGRTHPVVYRFIRQDSAWTNAYAITRSADPRASGAITRRLVSRADPFVQVTSTRTLSDMQAELLYPRRLGAVILVIAAAIGLLLSMLGVYGVVAYSAARRQREMGIRSTLGATRRDILALVLREGAVIVAAGASMGVVFAVAVVGGTAGLVAGMPRVDVLAFTAVPLVLAVVVLAACLVPALRASRVDPAVVLRGD